jgi:starch synthase (maltosyl-transferring)
MHTPLGQTWDTAHPGHAHGLSPKIYYVHPAIVGKSVAGDAWSATLERCGATGFNWLAPGPIFAPGEAGDIFLAGDLDRAHPAFGDGASADDVAARLARQCGANGLNLIIDVVIDRIDCAGEFAAGRRDLYGPPPERAPDPRSPGALSRIAVARSDSAEHTHALAGFWQERLRRLLDSGVCGFRFLNPHKVPVAFWRATIGALKGHLPAAIALAWTPGIAWSAIEGLSGAGFDGVFSSVAWWNFRAPWLIEEYDILRRVAPVLGCPEAPFDRRLAERIGADANVADTYRRALQVAAAAFDGMLVPMGFEHAATVAMDSARSTPADLDLEPALDLSADVRAANAIVDRVADFGTGNELRSLTDSADAVTALLRLDARDARDATRGLAILINPGVGKPTLPGNLLGPLSPAAGLPFGPAYAFDSGLDARSEWRAPLAPAEVRLGRFARTNPVRQRSRGERRLLDAAAIRPRIVIERISPAVDNGRFAVKRIAGERIEVEADIFCDGHGILAADLLWRAVDEVPWQRGPMHLRDNDRWTAGFTPARMGRHTFTVEAWTDEYATLCHDIVIKSAAGIDCAPELEQARRLIEGAAERTDGDHKAVLMAAAESNAAPPVDLLLSEKTRVAMRAAAVRHFRARQEPAIAVEIDRPQAAFAAWYELFPRSASPEPGRHGTFADVVGRLPAIRAMGFDVLYFPPIHPIGMTHRKGRNNSLTAVPGDPGSPYAIGGPEGGHDALHPELGTFADFAALQTAAAAHGLEIALDFAIQCSLDHPWLAEHPEWFRRRPDGSIRYAENPPKKYEDIVNVEFYADGRALPETWIALRNVVQFWVEHGIRIFRVDNPHTKPLPFWEWMIADVRARHPDVLFLAEAFTRPKMMYRLAKIGFSQSYTYFTWRNTKHELTKYLTELSSPPVSDFFRPNFFVNTPDINPPFLQRSGRPGFLIRAALAATLSPLWGMYSGFELCEADALADREEYRDSEKYEIKARDYDSPRNIATEIARLNRIRKSHPALQRQTGLTFYEAYNDHVIVYGKSSPGSRAAVVTAVCLDPFHAQEVTFELPLSRLGLPDHGAVAVNDLMRDRQFVWTGKMQRVRLDPADMPFAIWHVAPLSEHAQ